MTFTTEMCNGYVYVRVAGEWTGGNPITDFHVFIAEQLRFDHKIFIFNLEQCSWINSVGLGSLISILTTIKNAGGRLVLCHTDNIDDVLVVTRLKSIFEIFKTEAEACDAVNAPLPQFGSA